MLSRVCEEFGCMPSAAQRELLTDPEHLALDIIETRAYQRCKAAYDESKDEMDDKLDPWRDSPLLDTVIRITKELYEERRPRTGFKKPTQSPIILTDAD